jgi:hypothetical protein
VTDYGLEGLGSIPGRGKIFPFSISSMWTLGPTQPPIQWVPRDLSPGEKRLGHEADNLPPFSGECEDGGAIPPLPYMSSWNIASLYVYIQQYIIVPDFMTRRHCCCNNELVIHSKISNSHFLGDYNSNPTKHILLVIINLKLNVIKIGPLVELGLCHFHELTMQYPIHMQSFITLR